MYERVMAVVIVRPCHTNSSTWLMMYHQTAQPLSSSSFRFLGRQKKSINPAAATLPLSLMYMARRGWRVMMHCSVGDLGSKVCVCERERQKGGREKYP